jgi:epsilon-lactone hydrolase
MNFEHVTSTDMPSFRARIINALLRLTVKPMWRPGLAIDDIRRHTAKTDKRLARRGGDCPIEHVTIAGVRATWYGAPELAVRKGTLLYLHGGAWCVHLPALYGTFAARLSAATGLRVLLVDYRLAPEHPFPAAVDDCLAVYRSLLESAATRPRVLAGDSAGGNLSLITLMRARDALLPLPACAVLLSPATDITLGGPSVRYNAKADPMFSEGAGDLLPSLYCPGLDRTDPLISPLFGNWSGLPPLFFLAGSTEMLLDDSVRAHDRAQQARTNSRIDVWPDMPHVFPLFSMLPEAKQALGDIVAFIARHPLRDESLRHEGGHADASPTLGDPAHASDVALAVPETSTAL